MELIVITGHSGAGKTKALGTLEDIGYYCIDNMPPKLIPVFTDMSRQIDSFSKVAVVIDIRTGEFFSGLSDALGKIREQGISCRVLFLEASEDVLEKRYRETRRRHPLVAESERSTREAIEKEKEILGAVYQLADYRIDTSYLSTAQLKERLISMFSESALKEMRVRCISFGYKFGVPAEADLIFDVRCLPNPFYVEELRNLTGLDASVRDYVFDSDVTRNVLDKLYAFIDIVLPLYVAEGKSGLVIGIGCTGGRHRSVAVAEDMAKHIEKLGYSCRSTHRDCKKVY